MKVEQPLIAALWRKHTFSAAIPTLSPPLLHSLLQSHAPAVFAKVNPSLSNISLALKGVLDSSLGYSKTLHGNISSGNGEEGGVGSFYKGFVPEIGEILDPTKIGKF